MKNGAGWCVVCMPMVSWVFLDTCVWGLRPMVSGESVGNRIAMEVCGFVGWRRYGEGRESGPCRSVCC